MKAPSLEELLGSINPAVPIADNNVDEDIPDDFFEEQDEEDTFDEQAEEPDFQANLAEEMEEGYLEEIASELLQLVEDDLLSRKDWMNQINNFTEQIGIGQDSSFEEPFPGSSSVCYPMMTEAQIQFQARALPEIFPDNPANSVVIGESTPELEEQAERVKDVLNYQITYQDRGNKKDFRKMLWWLPLTGSTFRYVFHDTLRNMNKVRFVPVEDFIVPYATTSLEDAPHFTHRIRDNKNDILKLMNMGFYRTVPISEVTEENEEENNAAQELRDAADGQTKGNESDKVIPHSCYLIYADYDLQGYEDMDEETGEFTGIGLPYVFTIHYDTKKVLAIRRNWKQDDELREKRIYYTHYQYQEGPGFYGSGLPHLIGSLQTAATGALRSFGDALAFSIMQSGFKSKDATIVGNQVLSPGSFPDIDLMGADDINKVVKVLNFLPPTPQVLSYIDMLNNKAQTIVSTQQSMTGDMMPQNAPVGTTLAIIEQAQKVISAQHKSLYESLSEELERLADLNYDFLPDEATFSMPGKSGIMRRSDFDGKIDVIPTADPSVASFQQRQAIDQAVFQYSQVPEYKRYFRDGQYPLLRRQLENLGVPSIDEIIFTEEEVAEQDAQAAQNPLPPSPDDIKAQAIQRDSETRAMEAQSRAKQKDQELELQEDKQLIDAVLKAEDNDIKSGSLDMQTQQGIDNLTLQAIDKVSTDEQLPQQGVDTQPQMPVEQPVEQPPANPAKRNILMRLIDKVRGR